MHRQRRRGEGGQGLTEYSITAAVIAMLVIALIQQVGHRTSLVFCSVSNGLAQAGSLADWGDNSFGQLGNGGTPSPGTVPAAVNGICSVAADNGTKHAITLKPDGTVWTWGSNTVGALGTGDVVSHNSPVQVAGLPAGKTVVSVAAGTDTSAALMSDGTVYAWGDNTAGSAGNGAMGGSVLLPSQVIGTSGACCLSSVAKISAGNSTFFALDKNGTTMYSWGAGGPGSIGNGVFASTARPVAVVFPVAIADLSGSRDGGEALTTGGNVYAWGKGINGNLGNGTAVNSATPALVQNSGGTGPLSGVTAIAHGATSTSSYAVVTNGAVYAWGADDWGQIGNNSVVVAGCLCASLYPVQVYDVGGAGTTVSNVTSIARAQGYVAAIKTDGTVIAWGHNDNYELGLGSVSGGACACLGYPQAVPGVTRAISVAGGVGSIIVIVAPTGTPAQS